MESCLFKKKKKKIALPFQKFWDGNSSRCGTFAHVQMKEVSSLPPGLMHWIMQYPVLLHQPLKLSDGL